MSILDAWRHRLGTLLRPGDYERELDEEIQFHLSLEAMQRAHAARGGLSPAAARAAAERRFGDVTGHMEEVRTMAGLGLFDKTPQDVRYAVRTFRRAPVFTAVAILTLAIGIGANTAIFSAVNAMLLRPLPFAAPERLMKVGLTVPPRGDQPARSDVVWSYPKYVVFRDAQPLFADLALYTDIQLTVRGEAGTEAERDWGEYAGARYLPTLGIRPALGRNFLAEEDAQAGGPKVVILGDAFWKRRYNADPNILGQKIDIGGDPYTIVGVAPPNFRGLTGRADFWLPMMSQDPEMVKEAWSHSFDLVARLKPGVTPERAMQMMPQLGARVDAAYPHPEFKTEHWGAMARPLDAARVDPRVRRSLLVLLGAVSLVLLIACVNVANLFLVRAAGRRREIALRLAIGAGRGRLVRQLLTESLLLALVGGAASVVVAWWGVKLFAALDPASALRTQQLEGLGAVSFTSIRLDLGALGFAGALASLTGLLVGLVPALAATRPSLTGAIKEETARARGRRAIGGRNVLAAAEVALALVLLAGSGLMIRSLGNLLGVDPGFDRAGVLTMRTNARAGASRDSLPGYFDQVIERVGAVPGVTSVSLSDCPPLNGGCNGTVIAFRDRPPATPGTEPSVGVHWVTPSWFQTMRIPLVRGRGFTAADRKGVRKVVVINQTAARRFWPNADPIGRPVSVGQGGFWQDTATVVGVVGDTRYGTLDSLPMPDAYLPYAQSPNGRMMLFVRTTGDPLGIAAPVRAALRELAPDVPVYDMKTLDARVADAMSYARFSTVLLALFGAVALALAAIGTYGVIAYGVAQRTREIGVRVALGASRGDVVRLVVGQGLRVAAVGAAVGLAAALAATRVLRALLYEVAPSDPATFVGIVAVLLVAVVAPSWIPARRAAGIQPTEALREG